MAINKGEKPMKTGNGLPPRVRRALVEVLAKNGVISDEPEAVPDHWKAAERAFLMTGAGRTEADFKALARLAQTGQISRSAFYYKMACYCDGAHALLSETDPSFRNITFAWGYFSALAKTSAGSRSDASSAA